MFVSAVVPVYNSVNTLKRAIDSLLLQPEINEIFVVDDGSTDGSYKLAKELELIHPLIRVLHHEGQINKGASTSRNLGLEYCTNEWIQFLDADDQLLLGKVSDQIGLISSRTSFVVGPIIWNSSGRLKKSFYDRDVWNGLLVAKLGITSSNLWKKKCILEVGGWNENLINTQEYDLMFRIFKRFPNIEFSSNYNTMIYVVPTSLTRSKKNEVEKVENQYKLRLEILSYIKERLFFWYPYQLNFDGYIGTFLRNSGNPVNVKYSKFNYIIFKIRKSFLDRI